MRELGQSLFGFQLEIFVSRPNLVNSGAASAYVLTQRRRREVSNPFGTFERCFFLNLSDATKQPISTQLTYLT
ncbi:MAG: hypothetical protein C5B50_17340 [Verrucomicrobia bacterium]|nr:MAG: hypothetical protein C5B50_17340 [Verrucomicrobiota bacterium]